MPAERQTICVLDDDAAILKALRRLLRSDGLQMTAFEESESFLEHAESHAISLAIIDIWMPDVNGLEVQRRLLSIAPDTPVIMMTGRDDPTARSIALAQGAAEFLAKPFNDAVFLGAVRAALRPSN
jgi:FixJ family two-component response regulator